MLEPPLNEVPFIVRAFWRRVAVPALPETEPVMVLEKVLFPLKVLLSPRRVVEAVLSVMVLQPKTPEAQVTAFDALLQLLNPKPFIFVPNRLVVEAVVENIDVVVADVPVALVNVSAWRVVEPCASNDPSRKLAISSPALVVVAVAPMST